jgi:dsDNA-specific endonuclease/ATPase MutS2
MKEIRIRELRYDEAKAVLEKELHRAFMDGEMRVHVLHGIGDGILKKMTQEVASSLSFTRIAKQEIAPNYGVTVVDILTADPSLLRKYVR